MNFRYWKPVNSFVINLNCKLLEPVNSSVINFEFPFRESLNSSCTTYVSQPTISSANWSQSMTPRANRLALGAGYCCLSSLSGQGSCRQDVCTEDHATTFKLDSYLISQRFPHKTSMRVFAHSTHAPLDSCLMEHHAHDPFNGRVGPSCRVQRPFPQDVRSETTQNSNESRAVPNQATPLVHPPISWSCRHQQRQGTRNQATLRAGNCKQPWQALQLPVGAAHVLESPSWFVSWSSEHLRRCCWGSLLCSGNSSGDHRAVLAGFLLSCCGPEWAR